MLQHGRKRTEGTGEIYRQHRGQISRRELNRQVEEERQRQNRERNRVYHQVAWKMPRLMWAMDDSEYRPFPGYPEAYLHNVQDLASRYKVRPLVGWNLAHGEEVAAHLRELFEAHGAPLFLKRGNGSNLNQAVVDELLRAFLVIELNSPCRYPQYNGGIEAAQAEIKQKLAQRERINASFLSLEAEVDTQALNHKTRPCLNRRTSCEVFASGREIAKTYTARKRREVYDWIKAKTLSILNEEIEAGDGAWRLAVETWLLDNGFITVRNRKKVSPSSSENRSH